MSHVLRLALVDPRDESRDKLKSMLVGMDLVWLEAECSRYEFFADVVAQTNPDIGVVCMDSSPEKAIALIEKLKQVCPNCYLLALSHDTDGPTILKTMRAGAKEFLTLRSTLKNFCPPCNAFKKPNTEPATLAFALRR